MRQKKIVLVDRAFQLKYARIGFGVGFVSSCVTMFLILYPLFAFKILFIPNFLPPPIFALIALAIVLNCFVIGLFAVIVSHKISGPVFSMVRFLRDIQDGLFYRRFASRDNDELKFLSKHLNETVEALSVMTREDMNAVRQIKEQLSTLNQAGSVKEILDACDLLERKLESRIST